jgi:hypothetical protein
MHVPVKKPGPYQMRVVLRDTTSQRLGSSTQFTEVPDIKKGRLTLSGIVMGADRTRVGIDSTDGQIVAPDPNETPAVRIFKQGTTVVYAYAIFNARADRNKKAQLEVQARLFRDGQQVYTGAQVSMSSDAEQKTQLMAASGRLQLTQVTPGDYILQVVVTDKLAGDKYKVAAQSIDFEVRP